MNILVCIKQVPDTTEITIDPVKHTLVRQGVPSILNPFDGYALEAAARIKDAHPDTRIVVLSMGPDQAKQALRECLQIAADQAYLVSGRAFGGSDTYATSYILSKAVQEVQRREGMSDLIFCGKQAIDGDTAQVGPEIAEHLGLPQITCGLEASVEQGELRVLRETDTGTEVLGAPMPCLATFTKPAWDPRIPGVTRKIRAQRAEIVVLGTEDIEGMDPARLGLAGSPTKVKKSFTPPQRKSGRRIDGADAAEAAHKLYEFLLEVRAG